VSPSSPPQRAIPSHSTGNFLKFSLAGKEGNLQHTETSSPLHNVFINILCYKNIFGKITLIASFFVFYYTLIELFMTIHSGEGRGD
jgi:hypothetical protein